MSRELKRSVVASGAPDAIYAAWTDGAKSVEFFAPQNRIDPVVGGAFEQYFMLDAPAGERGSEGCVFESLDPGRSLGFTWNFPPHLSIRDERTHVVVELTAVDGGTNVELTQTGWGEGAVWDEGYAYFERAWRLVLDNLRDAFAEGRL